MAEEPAPALTATDAASEANKSVQVDPISAAVAASSELKEQLAAAEKEIKDGKTQEAVQTLLKKTVIVSGILAAAVSIVFTFIKTMKEK